MIDFHQEGIITTLHTLHEAFDRDEYLADLEQKFEKLSCHVKISLLIPLSLHGDPESAGTGPHSLKH